MIRYNTLIFLVIIVACKKQVSAKSNVGDKIPILTYSEILALKNPIEGQLVYDKSNLALKIYFDSLWQYPHKLRPNNGFTLYLSSLNNQRPKKINQIGLYNNNWYLATSVETPPYWELISYSEETKAIYKGNNISQKSFPISRIQNEKFAHDSKLLVINNTGYVSYYSSDNSTIEGSGSQKIIFTTFNINNPSSRNYYEVFKPGERLGNNIIIDQNLPCYSPVLLKLSTNKIRIFAVLYIKGVQTLCFRDFDIETKLFAEPAITFFTSTDGSLRIFNQLEIKKELKLLFGSDYQQNAEFMYLPSEPVTHNGILYIGLSVGLFSSNANLSEGTTLIVSSEDDGVNFKIVGAPDPRKLPPNIPKQLHEGAFEFLSDNTIVMICRNDKKGVFYLESEDNGKSFSIPQSINSEYGSDTKNSKLIFKKLPDGNFMSFWNIERFVINPLFGFMNRTILDIRVGPNTNPALNPIKSRIVNFNGVHYPSISIANNNIFFTSTRDSRRITSLSVGEITFSQINYNDLK